MRAMQRDEMAHGISITQKSCVNRAIDLRSLRVVKIPQRVTKSRSVLGPFYKVEVDQVTRGNLRKIFDCGLA